MRVSLARSRFFASKPAVLLSLLLLSCGQNPQSHPPSLPVAPIASAPVSLPEINPSPTPGASASPSATVSPSPASPVTQAGFATCVSDDDHHQCLGLKLVSFQNEDAPALMVSADAGLLVEKMNKVWSQCDIAFQLEAYAAVNPLTVGLSFDPDWQTEGGTVRAQFEEENKFLVVVVGALGGSTIAVTEMPGSGPYGTLVEALFSQNPLTVGHELGHYMGLYHVSRNNNLMNPYIGPHTEMLTSSQCKMARDTNISTWPHVMRSVNGLR